jgi:membrane protease YdiL (CAAX protease family)
VDGSRWIDRLAGNGISPDRKEQAVEVAVFLSLILPSDVLSLFVAQEENLGFVLIAVITILRGLALVGLVCFFLWKNGEPMTCVGWIWRRSWKEIILGGVLFVPFLLGALALAWTLLRAGLSPPRRPPSEFLVPHRIGELFLAVPFVAVAAVVEETIFRGYLLLRFGAVLRSTWAAILLSSAIFAIGHSYEGSAGMVWAGVMGFAYALLYLWRESLVAPVVLHFLHDFAAMVVLFFLRPK